MRENGDERQKQQLLEDHEDELMGCRGIIFAFILTAIGGGTFAFVVWLIVRAGGR